VDDYVRDKRECLHRFVSCHAFHSGLEDGQALQQRMDPPLVGPLLCQRCNCSGDIGGL
jgi:hypothetical protein